MKITRYEVPPKKGVHCGGIFIFCNDGYFSCVTDYGNYAYKFDIGNKNTEEFLLSLDMEYLLSKISSRSAFDIEKTKENIVRDIGSLHDDEFPDIEDFLKQLNGATSEGEIEHLLDIYEVDTEICNFEWDYPILAKNFYKILLPDLAKVIKEGEKDLKIGEVNINVKGDNNTFIKSVRTLNL